MSTILKALRRLEDDKLASQPVSLEESIVTPAEAMRASSRWSVVFGIASGVVVLLLGVAVFVRLQPSTSADVTASAPASGSVERHRVVANPLDTETRPRDTARTDQQPEAASSPLLAPVGASAPAQHLGDSPSGRSSEARSLSPDAQTPVPEPLTAANSAEVLPPEPHPSIEDLPLGSPERRALRASPDVVAAPTSVSVTEPPPVAAVRRTTSVGPVEIIERAPRAAFTVTQTVWHPSPTRRLAIVELESGVAKRLGEGDVVGGFTVGTIGLAEVEFVRGGVSIQKRVGSR
jgi:hypothetical protein